MEKHLSANGTTMAAIDSICKLASRRPVKQSIEEKLANNLTGFCGVVAWIAILKDLSSPPVVLPSDTPVDPVAVQVILSEVDRSEKAWQGDFFLVDKKSRLYARLLPLLRAPSRAAGALQESDDIFAVPVLAESTGNSNEFSRLWIVFAVFPADGHPGGPVYDQIRLFGQSALLAWDSAERTAEANRKEGVIRETIRTMPGLKELVGETPVMENLRLEILRVARSDNTVLLVGEQGTGKEVAARLIHYYSRQADFQFICRRLAEELKVIMNRSKGFYPSDFTTVGIVNAEFRDVPGVGSLPGKARRSSKQPKPVDEEAEEVQNKAQRNRLAKELDPDLMREVGAQEQGLRTRKSLPPVFRALVRTLHRLWKENPLFNFFEFDSGAASEGQNISAELFGVPAERFTGVAGGPGRFQSASHCGGTLFLDNIHHLPRAVQSALLKATEVIHEERCVTRSGAATSEPVHIRIITASTEDLGQLVDEGKFLPELASRLMVEVIRIPPLRDRREDIPLLASHFAARHGKTVGADAVELLIKPDWKDANVRGLRSVVESAASRTDGGCIRRKDIEAAWASIFSATPEMPGQVMTQEERMVREALEKTGGKVQKAARDIGWSRQKLYRAMDKYGIPRGKGRDS